MTILPLVYSDAPVKNSNLVSIVVPNLLMHCPKLRTFKVNCLYCYYFMSLYPINHPEIIYHC